MKNLWVSLCVIVFILSITEMAHSAPRTWKEVGDAGELIDTAQATRGSKKLDFISGELTETLGTSLTTLTYSPSPSPTLIQNITSSRHTRDQGSSVKFALPLLNTPCCHCHEFNLASSFSPKK